MSNCGAIVGDLDVDYLELNKLIWYKVSKIVRTVVLAFTVIFLKDYTTFQIILACTSSLIAVSLITHFRPY